MNALTCELCGGNEIVKQDGYYVCQHCGTKYSVEDAKRMMIEGTVDVQGTVKVDNSAFVNKYLTNARRALDKDDWEEVEKYYNLVEQNVTNNMEAVFFSSFGKAMLALTSDTYYVKQQKFNVLNKSISVINDYYELTTESRETVLRRISDSIAKMATLEYVYDVSTQNGVNYGTRSQIITLMNNVRKAFLTELQQIKAAHNDEAYIDELIEINSQEFSKPGCYVATAVYGSYDCPQVWTLRRYRDYTLAETWYGRLFVHTYYAVSPTLVKWFGNTEWFRNFWKPKLDRMVEKLNREGVEDTPYNDRTW